VRSTFLTLVPIAVAVGLSPIALVQMILVLLSRRSRTNGPIFLAAVTVEVFLLAYLSATLLSATAEDAAGRQPILAVVLLAGAAGLLVLAIRSFRARHEQKVPAILDAIDTMGPKGVLLLSFGATVLNPKNLLLLISAGSVAGEQGYSSSDVALLVLAFTAVAMLPFSLMVGATLFGGDGTARRLDRWKVWLLANNQLLMAGILLLLAVMLAVKGIDAL
jgi:threonine/homoserine/homoserine lactone efflux protein